MRKIIVAAVIGLVASGCSTPLPCVFNDTPECEARWRPVMERQVQPMPMYFPPPYVPVPPAPAYGTMTNPAYCHAQPAGYDTMITCH